MTSHVNTAGVQLALISNRIEGIVRKMSNTLLRTGRSGVLAMARDFSCCVVTLGAPTALLLTNGVVLVTRPLCCNSFFICCNSSGDLF